MTIIATIVLVLMGWGASPAFEAIPMESMAACARAAADIETRRGFNAWCIDSKTGDVLKPVEP